MATGGAQPGPHLLVIGGQPNILCGGAYALCCHLLSKLHMHMTDITILSQRNEEELDAEDVRFRETIRDAAFMEPEASDEMPTDYLDALDNWEKYYSDLENSDITHVLVVNPHGIVALSDGKLIESLENPVPKVAILNNLSPPALSEYPGITELDFLGWTKKDVSLVMSIGPHLHGLWQKELDAAAELVPLELQHVNVSPLSPLAFTKSPGNQNQVHHIHTLPCSKSFLEAAARALSQVAVSLAAQHESVAWTVWTYNDNSDYTALQASLTKQLEDRVQLSLRPLTSLADLQSQLEKSSLAIQDGCLNVHGGYSGIETLMCGVPTLLPNRPTELSQLLRSIDAPKAGYFVLPDDQQKWSQKIFEVLADEGKAVEHAIDLAKVVQAHNNKTLKVFATWLGIPEAITDDDTTVAPPPTPARTLRPFLQKKDFTIYEEQKLGEGGFGKVFCGEFKGETVAIKSFTTGMNKRVFNEIEILKSIQHENIVTVHGVCIHEQIAFIVMEKLPLNMTEKIIQNLREKDPQKQLSMESKMRVALGLAKAVVYIHSLQIVHQDIKGLNIMLTADLVAKLCDFGLARVKAHASRRTSTAGGIGCTEVYSAPEVFEGKYRPQKCSDIWSVCCALVEWFSTSGRLWSSRKANSFKMEIQSGNPPFHLARVSPEWVKIVLAQGFHKDPTLRPTAEELLRSFEGKAPVQRNVPNPNGEQNARSPNLPHPGQQQQDPRGHGPQQYPPNQPPHLYSPQLNIGPVQHASAQQHHLNYMMGNPNYQPPMGPPGHPEYVSGQQYLPNNMMGNPNYQPPMGPNHGYGNQLYGSGSPNNYGNRNPADSPGINMVPNGMNQGNPYPYMMLRGQPNYPNMKPSSDSYDGPESSIQW